MYAWVWMHVCTQIQRFCLSAYLFSFSICFPSWQEMKSLRETIHLQEWQASPSVWAKHLMVLALLHRRSVQLITAQDTWGHSSVLGLLYYWVLWHNDLLVSNLPGPRQVEWDMVIVVASGYNESGAGTAQINPSSQVWHVFLGAGIHLSRRYGTLACFPPHPLLSPLAPC